MLLDLVAPTENSLICQRAVQDGKRRNPHWFPWLMLVWTLWLFVTPLYDAKDYFPNWFWPTTLSFVLFLFLFYRVYYRDRKYIFHNALGIALLAFVVTPFNPGAQDYMIYACAFFGISTNIRAALRNMLLLIALYGLEWWLLEYPWVYLFNAIAVSLAVGLMNVNFMRKHEREAELKLSHDEVRRLAALAERERIGRDLHDLLGHTLSLITLKSELANRLFERDPAAARVEIADVERVARDALGQVRRAVTGIRAAGIAAEIASAKLLLESNGVYLEYTLVDVALPLEVETVLAMTLREAVTNIQRHAFASSASVRLAVEDKRLVLRISDDGRGGAMAPGNGLTGMRERAVTIDAQLRIDSVRGRGTTLELSLPLPEGSLAAANPAPALRPA
ncbi:MAG TPA: sensor histidine kinase [Rudaea sp.]